MANTQSMTKLPMRFYSLMPGDATHYRFGFFDIGSRWRADIPNDVNNQSSLFPGTSKSEFVGVLIAMPHAQGYYELRKESIRNVHRPYVGYVCNHMSDGLIPYTVCAVLLALSVLIDNPEDLDGACRQMLRVPYILSPKGE